jgi:hypothetical protein
MKRNALLLSVLVAGGSFNAHAASAQDPGRVARAVEPPRVRVWVDDDRLRYGAPIRVNFRVDQDAFVTIGRVERDGTLQIIFPRSPNDNAAVYGGEDYYVDARAVSSASYRGGNYGYVFAIASYEPLDLSAFARGNTWRYTYAANFRLTGRPEETIEYVADRILFDRETTYGYDLEFYSSRDQGYGLYASRFCVSYYCNQYGAAYLSTFCDPYLGYSGFMYTAFNWSWPVSFFSYSNPCYNGGYAFWRQPTTPYTPTAPQPPIATPRPPIFVPRPTPPVIATQGSDSARTAPFARVGRPINERGRRNGDIEGINDTPQRALTALRDRQRGVAGTRPTEGPGLDGPSVPRSEPRPVSNSAIRSAAVRAPNVEPRMPEERRHVDQPRASSPASPAPAPAPREAPRAPIVDQARSAPTPVARPTPAPTPAATPAPAPAPRVEPPKTEPAGRPASTEIKKPDPQP